MASCDTLKKINVTCFPNVFDLQSICLEHTRQISHFLLLANDRVASLSEHDGSQDLLITSQKDGSLISTLAVPRKSVALAYRRADDRLFVQDENGALVELDQGALKEASGDLGNFNASMLAERRSVFFTEDLHKGIAIAVEPEDGRIKRQSD